MSFQSQIDLLEFQHQQNLLCDFKRMFEKYHSLDVKNRVSYLKTINFLIKANNKKINSNDSLKEVVETFVQSLKPLEV